MPLFGQPKMVKCAICGAEAKTGFFRSFFQKEIAGQYVCKECYGDVDLPMGMVEKMSLDAFKKYRAFRAENRKLLSDFKTTHLANVGKGISFDMNKRLMCVDKAHSTTVFLADEIQSFTIKEDNAVIFQGNAGAIVCNVSKVPEMIQGMSSSIQAAQIQMKLYQRQLESAPEEKKEEIRQKKPVLKLNEPFSEFTVEINFKHPYWSSKKVSVDAPCFDKDDPSVQDYMNAYTKKYTEMENLAGYLAELAFPKAMRKDNRIIAAGAAPAGSADVVGELKRFKELMDLGVITKEEFEAKKKQLLGL